jgi:hypothetical protein
MGWHDDPSPDNVFYLRYHAAQRRFEWTQGFHYNGDLALYVVVSVNSILGDDKLKAASARNLRDWGEPYKYLRESYELKPGSPLQIRCFVCYDQSTMPDVYFLASPQPWSRIPLLTPRGVVYPGLQERDKNHLSSLTATRIK